MNLKKRAENLVSRIKGQVNSALDYVGAIPEKTQKNTAERDYEKFTAQHFDFIPSSGFELLRSDIEELESNINKKKDYQQLHANKQALEEELGFLDTTPHKYFDNLLSTLAPLIREDVMTRGNNLNKQLNYITESLKFYFNSKSLTVGKSPDWEAFREYSNLPEEVPDPGVLWQIGEEVEEHVENYAHEKNLTLGEISELLSTIKNFDWKGYYKYAAEKTSGPVAYINSTQPHDRVEDALDTLVEGSQHDYVELSLNKIRSIVESTKKPFYRKHDKGTRKVLQSLRAHSNPLRRGILKPRNDAINDAEAVVAYAVRKKVTSADMQNIDGYIQKIYSASTLGDVFKNASILNKEVQKLNRGISGLLYNDKPVQTESGVRHEMPIDDSLLNDAYWGPKRWAMKKMEDLQDLLEYVPDDTNGYVRSAKRVSKKVGAGSDFATYVQTYPDHNKAFFIGTGAAVGSIFTLGTAYQRVRDNDENYDVFDFVDDISDVFSGDLGIGEFGRDVWEYDRKKRGLIETQPGTAAKPGRVVDQKGRYFISYEEL